MMAITEHHELDGVPDGWSMRQLRDDVTLLSGHHVLARYVNVEGVGTPYLTGPADFPEGHIQQTKFATRPSTLCGPGDILVTVKGSGCGSLTQADGEYCISRQLMAVRPKQWNTNFVLYSLLQNGTRIRAAVTGLIPGLSRGDILDQPLPIPDDRAEQDAIAEALSDMDGLIGALDKLIAKKLAIKQAAMQQLLTGKTRLPGFSGEWKTYLLGDLEKIRWVSLGRGQVISKQDIEANPGYYPIYSSSVANEGLFGTYGKYMFDEELVTWSIDGGGNFFYRPKHKFSVTNVCGFMRTDARVLHYRYLAYQLQILHLSMRFDYLLKAHPSVIKRLYIIPVPSLEEQIAIATVLSDMDAEIEALERRRDKTRQIKQGMMQQLLTGRIRLVQTEVN